MLCLFIHDDAKNDLEMLWHNDPVAAARIVALLEELEGDPNLLDRLTQQDFGGNRSADFHVSKWLEHWRNGKDLWRLKIWDLESQGLRYRIVYAFIPRKRDYYVLGFVPREFNYAPDHPFTRRILKAYEGL